MSLPLPACPKAQRKTWEVSASVMPWTHCWLFRGSSGDTAGQNWVAVQFIQHLREMWMGPACRTQGYSGWKGSQEVSGLMFCSKKGKLRSAQVAQGFIESEAVENFQEWKLNCSHSNNDNNAIIMPWQMVTQMIVAVQKGHLKQWDAIGLLWVPLHSATCPQRPGLFTSLGVTHWAKLWFTFGLCPMSLTAEVKAAHVPGSYLGISSHSSSETLWGSSVSESWSLSQQSVLVHCWLWVAGAWRFASNFSFLVLCSLITALHRITKLLSLKGTSGGYPVQICAQSRVSHSRLLTAESTSLLNISKDRLHKHLGQPVLVFKHPQSK